MGRWLAIGLTLAVLGVVALGRSKSPEATRAANVTGVTASASSAALSASATYTIAFTNASAIPASGGRIHFQFTGPSGSGSASSNINFNSATLASTTSPTTLQIYSYDWNGLTLSTTGAIAANTAISVVVNSVVNPARGGYFVPHVWTTTYSSDLDGSGSWGGETNGAYLAMGTNVNVTGTVTDAASAPVAFAGVSISGTGSGAGASNYYSTYTDKNGVYGLADVSAGTYSLMINYSVNNSGGKNYFPPDSATITVASSGVVTKNASFLAATKVVSGKLTKDTAAGAAIASANIYVYKQNGGGWLSTATQADGSYSLTLTGGTWVFSISSSGGTSDWLYSTYNDSVTFASDTSSETKTKNFVAESLSSAVTGKIVRADGSAPPNQWSVGLSFTNAKSQWFSAQIASNGAFTAKTTAGTFSVSGWVSNDLGESFPAIANFSVDADHPKNLGTITLIKKTDRISGKITDSTGAVVAGASVSAWKNTGGYDWGNATTDSAGNYSILVVPGAWQVSAWPQWKDGGSDYVSSGKPVAVAVTSGVVATQNFVFQVATNTLNVTITDPDGNVLTTANSWVSAGDGSQEWGNIGGSVTNGVGKVKLPSGTWTIRTYLSDPNYGSPESQNVTFSGNNETKAITMKATKNNATLSGTIYDDAGNVITGKYMSVYATRGRNSAWYNGSVNQDTGTYSLKLSAGTYQLGYWMDRSLGYNSGSSQDTEITIGDGESKTFDIRLKQAKSTIKGKATKSNGDPMTWAWITADTRDSNEKKSADTMYYNNGVSSNNVGDYELKVPAGTYFIGGSMWPGSGYLNPKRQKVTVKDNETATVDLTFRAADATIVGRANLDSTGVKTYVTAWGEDGAYAEANSNNAGDYELAVSSGTKWHLRAIYLDGKTVYKSKETIVDLTGTKSASQDLALVKQSFTLPDAQTVTFDGSQPQAVALTDGTTLTIPAGAIASSGNVTVTAEPKADLAEQDNAKPVTGYGYDLTATGADGNAITAFTSNITIETPVTDDQLAASNVKTGEATTIGYYDTATATWKELDNCTEGDDPSDATKTIITCQVNHFTRFAVVAATDSTPPEPPQNVKAAAGDGAATLTWSASTSADAASVTVYRSTASGTLGQSLKTGIANTTYTATGLTNGTTYYFTLRSVDTSGNESVSSTQVSAVPAATATTLPKTGRPSQSPWGLVTLALLGGLACLVTRRVKI